MTARHSRRHEIEKTVSAEDIDELGHVNNVVYLQWVNEVAVAHWRRLATPEQQARWVWVAVRHEIDYRKPGLPGDRLVVRTWVADAATGATFDRFTEVVRPADGQVLARARTVWCLIEAATGRPRRVDPALEAQFFEERPA